MLLLIPLICVRLSFAYCSHLQLAAKFSRLQAQCLARALAPLEPSVVASSKLQRAKMTADQVAGESAEYVEESERGAREAAVKAW